MRRVESEKMSKMTTTAFIKKYGGSYENGKITYTGSLYLSGTQIAALPDNLTVGGYLDLSGTQISAKDRQKVLKLKDGDFVRNRYIYADGTLTHIVGRQKTLNDYTFYKGRIPGQNVVSAVVDGKTIYAHCKTLESGARDIADKLAESLGEEQYKNWTLETVLTQEEARRAYHIIARACFGGIDRFMVSLRDDLKEQYTVRELAELTRGQYGGDRFSAFVSAHCKEEVAS